MQKNMNTKKEKNRLSLFIENMLAYGLTTVLEKLVPLIMLPIITGLLTDTADYGRYDMFNTIVQFGTNIAVLGMYDAMFREFFEKDDDNYRINVTSTAMTIVLFSSILVFLILAVFSSGFSRVFLGDSESKNIVILSAIAVVFSAYKNIVSAPIRMENKKKIYAFFSIGGSIVYYFIAILFVVNGLNYAGLIYANIIYVVISFIAYLCITKKYFVVKKWDTLVAKNLFKIGVPLLPTFLAYWVFHAMDKIMITNILGLGELGVYSVGAKVAQVSQIIYSAFAVGWQYFAFSRMKDSDQVELNTKVMEYLGVISFVAFMIAIIFDNFVFNLFFSGEYVRGVAVFPYLFLSPLILMLYQVVGNQTLVYKKSYLNTLCLVFGTITNFVLNCILIKHMGIQGAAIATLLSYVVSYICIMIVAQKMRWLNITKKYLTILILVFMFNIIYTIGDGLWINFLAGFSVLLILLTYRQDIKKLILVLRRNYDDNAK